MSSLSSGGIDITQALQSRMPAASSLGAVKALSSSSVSSPADTRQASATEPMDEAKAREAANKFESLLIHNMLKSMRKTTMTEDKSNDRAIYDDMLDEKLADTMIKAGGIGIADQIVSQIREQQGTTASAVSVKSDGERLRELAQHLKRPLNG